MRRLIRTLLIFAFLVLAATAGWFWYFSEQKLSLPTTPFEFVVKPGASLKSLSRQLTEAGLTKEPYSLWLLGRATEQAAKIRAGSYQLDAPITPMALLRKLNEGVVVPMSITFIEGSTFADMRAQIEADENVRVTLKGLSDGELLKRIGAVEKHPEGLFFPDTYRFAAGATDLELFKMAYQTMQKKLAETWASRAPNLPYKSPYEALIMASIIEKETGRAEERTTIGSVFVNRLRIPMRLQTDPTVIYGMGARFDGNIRKRDLTADTPYNTYTRDGLPPTPIALPGLGSLQGALKPATADYLYFVGKGDGSHYFSRSLVEHNRAVAKYQLGR